MAFFFTCGTHSHENITVQCQNCGNWSGKVVKRWEWFTLCFIPIIPFSLKPYHCVNCHICHFQQDLKFRPDVQQQMDGGGGGQPIPMQNGPAQGWNNGNPNGGQGGGQYQQPQGQPQYK